MKLLQNDPAREPEFYAIAPRSYKAREGKIANHDNHSLKRKPRPLKAGASSGD
jgi:hypothetical protein